jgi:hypothetical protein
MRKYLFTATFSNGETITRKAQASYGKAWAVLVKNKNDKVGTLADFL